LVHLDPDLRRQSVPRKPGWTPCFGQLATAQSHLAAQQVGVGDVFLFFGWFRQAERHGDRWRFVPGAPNIHSLFGWLQIGDVIAASDRVAVQSRPSLHDHPHVVFADQMSANNTLYLGAEKLFDGKAEGAGTFDRWTPRLQLTAEGSSRSIWRLPAWMHPTAGQCAMTYHTSPARWQLEGDACLLQSVAKGQEFVINVGDSQVAQNWLSELINNDSK
jgi:hypothetical protein